MLQVYRAKVLENPALNALRRALDAWCAAWFWPADALDLAPTPRNLLRLESDARAEVARLAQKLRFFHWEIEFPDVMTGPESGFHAIVGNPPWETQKPISMEFFSDIDPLYRTYTKQEALQKQKSYFQKSGDVEGRWVRYNAHFKALSNWTKHTAFPFGADGELGQPLAGIEAELQAVWRTQRAHRTSYSDPEHPYRHQGSADINTYKMFLETAHALLRPGGSFGFLVPSGVYSDNGTQALRNLLLDRCEWTHLYAFQNERYVFDGIDHRFKMAVLHARKGSRTSKLKTRFRLGPGDSPEASEIADDLSTDELFLPLPLERIRRFSPNTRSIMEVRTERDLQVLEKLYTKGVLLGDQSATGWPITYATEFHMTNDSELFPPRAEWEAKGYKADEYGHWLKGPWKKLDPRARKRDWSIVHSLSRNEGIAIRDIQGVALPLYEGRMIDQFDYSCKGWVSGRGRKAKWEELDWSDKRLQPQFLMGLSDHQRRREQINDHLSAKLGFMDVTASTNERTFIGSILPPYPGNNKAPTLLSKDQDLTALTTLLVLLNSMTCDSILRQKLGGNSLTAVTLEELPVPLVDKDTRARIRRLCLSLASPSPLFAAAWLAHESSQYSWRRLWAVTAHERVRIRAILDACAASLYGLDEGDFKWIIQDCDYPSNAVCNKKFARGLAPKGFWRADKERSPEVRHAILSFVAFTELKRIGFQTFLALNKGDGWSLPDTLRLADYDLGHDDRAKQHQPVASSLGDRFLPWQVNEDANASWEECRQHAALLKQIMRTGIPSVPPSAKPPALADSERRLKSIVKAEPKAQTPNKRARGGR